MFVAWAPSLPGLLNIVKKFPYSVLKSRIRETKNLSTDADSSTIFFYLFFFFFFAAAAKGAFSF